VFLIVKALKRKPGEKSLIVIVGRSVAKKAVLRNKIKRRLRVIGNEIVKFKNPDKKYVIVVKPDAVKLNFKELKKETLGGFRILSIKISLLMIWAFQ